MCIRDSYCVQFISFKRASLDVLLYWYNCCLYSCSEVHHNGIFGDQKYLDRFEELAPGLVYVHSPGSHFQAPWNSSIYPYSEAIAYHFHGLRFSGGRSLVLLSAGYYLPEPCIQYIYGTYLSVVSTIAKDYSISIPTQANCKDFSRTIHFLRILRALILLKRVRKDSIKFYVASLPS